MKDFFCTPEQIAREMVSAIRITDDPVIADFAVGDGSLLIACQAKWPHGVYYAIDIQDSLIAGLKDKQPNWKLLCCDFLNDEAVNHGMSSLGLTKCSVIIINPPFTCKGSTRYSSTYRGFEVKTSLAMAFVIKSLRFLSETGEMIALLPSSCLSSEKDSEAWSLIKRDYIVDHIFVNSRSTFAKCSAATEVVRLSRDIEVSNSDSITSDISSERILVDITLHRGSFPMPLVKTFQVDQGIPLIHTTCLCEQQVDLSKYSISLERNTVQGPLVILPRIGRPDLRKIVAVYDSSTKFVLSDCLFALAGESSDVCKELLSLITSNWSEISMLYRGTGAKYLTRKVFAEYLSFHGYRVNY